MKQKSYLEDKIKKLLNETQNNTLAHFAGSAIVTFDTIKDKEKSLKKLPNNLIKYTIRFFLNLFYYLSYYCKKRKNRDIEYLKRNINYDSAPNPEDILFQNLETTTFERILRTLLFFFISIIICFVSLIIVGGLYRAQELLDENEEHRFYLYFLSIIISLILEIIDFVLGEFLEYLTKNERQITYTNFHLSYSIKLTISSSLNSALVPFLSEIIFTKSKRYEVLIGNLFIEFLFNSFLTPIFMVFNFSFLLKKIKLCFRNCYRTQKELNELYELSDMDISSKYSYIAKTVLMSFFYIPIFPLGIIISFGGFLFFYWVEKINFAKMCKRPKKLNRQFPKFYNNFLIIALFAYGVGDYIFLSDVYETRTWSLVNIIIYSVMFFIPYHQLLNCDCLKIKESDIYKKTYEEAYLELQPDYERENPMTRKEGFKKYYQRLIDSRQLQTEINIDELVELKNVNILSLYFNNRSESGYESRNNYHNRFNFNLYTDNEANLRRSRTMSIRQ